MNVKGFLSELSATKSTHHWHLTPQHHYLRSFDPRVGCLVDPLAVLAMNRSPGREFYVVDHAKAAAVLGLSEEDGKRLTVAADSPKAFLRPLLIRAAIEGRNLSNEEIPDKDVEEVTDPTEEPIETEEPTDA